MWKCTMSWAGGPAAPPSTTEKDLELPTDRQSCLFQIQSEDLDICDVQQIISAQYLPLLDISW